MADTAIRQAARDAVYKAGVIIDTFNPHAEPLSMAALAEVCDLLGVRRPIELQVALADEERAGG